MMQNYFAIAVLLATAYAINGGVNMTSRVTPFQVTFGEDGRLRIEDFKTKTACGYAPATAFNDAPQSPCATYQTTSNNKIRIPVNGSTISFPVRLDFTLKSPNSNNIQVRFMGGSSKIYVVEFRRGEGLKIEGASPHLDLQFDESHRFWVTYENGEVKVGLHGTDSPLVQYTDPDFKTNQVEYIELYSKSQTNTEWKFYEPCTFPA